MSQCVSCGCAEMAGALFCSECGAQLVFAQDEAAIDTLIYPKTAKIQTGSGAFNLPLAPADPRLQARISLRMVESGDLIPLPPGKEVTLGRMTNDQPIVPDVDLAPYNAYQCGVSRLHASVKALADKVFIIDLGSANGTRVNGKRIPAHTPYPLNHGDVLILGKMKIQVFIRS